MLWTIHEAASEIRAGRLSPVELLEECFRCIDRHESSVRAWVLIDREGAREQAEQAAKEIRTGHYRGPLHGIPVGIKDIIDVFDWPTACGSKLWERSIARQDAPVVRRLRQAGAVLVGKTVTTQYASFDPPVTRNPWNPQRTPGGSSSGSAAAVACGMCLAALATQTGGSITRPASFCGVAGLKPTYGRVCLDGVLPLAPSMDHMGVIAGCIRDLALVFQVIDGQANHAPSMSVPRPDLEVGLSPAKRLRIVRLLGLFDTMAEQSVREFMEVVTKQLGVEESEALPAAFREVLLRHGTLMAVESATFHQLRLKRHPEDYGPRIRSLLETGLACPGPEYARAKEHQAQLSQEMDLLAKGNVWLTPATTSPAPDAATTGDPSFNSPWSYTGLPTVSLPAGWSPDGLPLAIQLAGARWTEADLLSTACWCEERIGFRRREPLS